MTYFYVPQLTHGNMTKTAINHFVALQRCLLEKVARYKKSYTVLKTAKLVSRYRTNVATTRGTEQLTDVSPNLFPNAEWGFYVP